MRKIVTIRKISEIFPIEGADFIMGAMVDGWTTVINKASGFTVGEDVVYFEIDSFLPETDARWNFLPANRTFNGVRGHVLKTVRKKKMYSNGLILKLDQFPEFEHLIGTNLDDVDLAPLIGVTKYEVEDSFTGSNSKGSFPSFIRKSDQERCQNLRSDIFNIEPKTYSYVNGNGEEIVVTKPPVNTADTKYEVSIKMDGSSMTVFIKDGQTGVCSRNLELKLEDGGTFVDVFNALKLDEALKKLAELEGTDYAFQGELCGPRIQGNQEQLSRAEFFVYNVFDIKNQKFVAPNQRMDLYLKLENLIYQLGGDASLINHVPIVHHEVTLDELNLKSVADLLVYADGPSFNPKVKREGLVFKRTDGDFSFKAISEKWLANKKD